MNYCYFNLLVVLKVVVNLPCQRRQGKNQVLVPEHLLRPILSERFNSRPSNVSIHP